MRYSLCPLTLILGRLKTILPFLAARRQWITECCLGQSLLLNRREKLDKTHREGRIMSAILKSCLRHQDGLSLRLAEIGLHLQGVSPNSGSASPFQAVSCEVRQESDTIFGFGRSLPAAVT